ncbi:MAG: peptidoglycan-associated lipoprotein Pal [Acidobacteria bacterium]|nr:peptidoglycan-associated lipoprotein Pal [Acidobacteriota bacterium]
MKKRADGSLMCLMAVFLLIVWSGCAKRQPPVARPAPPPPAAAPATPGVRPPAPPQPVSEPPVVPPEPVPIDELATKTLDELNRDSPLGPVFFEYDSAELPADAQAQLTTNAAVLKQRATWVITIEGHCDERGTAEYNLALGERRAAAARTYLMSLGIAADRVKTVSYGKEFPFDPGNTEAAYAKNRRAHFVITAK